jgi:hypothetical protein
LQPIITTMQNMKHEWRENEKEVYLPEAKPVIVEIPKYKFLTLEGVGNQTSKSFTENIVALYAMSYGIMTAYKKGSKPEGYFEYTVYPVESVWEEGIEAKKDDLVYKLMIRQPDFVTSDVVDKIRIKTIEKKSHGLYNKVAFEEIEGGKCVQMLHLGSYAKEATSFKTMTAFANESKITRSSKAHREIYLSDSRKASSEELQTVLRFQVK